jgi:hypothetical protein
VIKKLIRWTVNIGLFAFFGFSFLAGIGFYFLNYVKSPEDPQSVAAFNERRIENPDAARMVFHDAMGPCVKEILGETITGRHSNYLADMFYTLSDPNVSADINSSLKKVAQIEHQYADILISQSMTPTPEERNFMRVQAKMHEVRGDMNFYNCLLTYDKPSKEAVLAPNELVIVPETETKFAEWELLPTYF